MIRRLFFNRFLVLQFKLQTSYYKNIIQKEINQ